MTWHNESRRHSLASKGVKTAVANKPLAKVPENYYEDEDGVLRGRCSIHGDFVGDAVGCPKCFGESVEKDAQKEERIIKMGVYDILVELKPMLSFLEFHVDDDKEEARVSLRSDISFKEFNKFYPEIKRKDLIKLFDRLDENKRESYFALQDMTKGSVAGERTISPPIPDTPSRFENPPLGYDDWEQFKKEYSNEVDEYGD